MNGGEPFAAAGNAYKVADMASLLQACAMRARKTGHPGRLAYSSDFLAVVALMNNIPTLALELNGLSIATSPPPRTPTT